MARQFYKKSFLEEHQNRTFFIKEETKCAFIRTLVGPSENGHLKKLKGFQLFIRSQFSHIVSLTKVLDRTARRKGESCIYFPSSNLALEFQNEPLNFFKLLNFSEHLLPKLSLS